MTLAHVLVFHLLGVGEGASPGPQMLEMQDYVGFSQNGVSLEDLGSKLGLTLEDYFRGGLSTKKWV